MILKELLLKISFDPEKMNKVGIITRERIELGKTKSIIIEMKKVWE